MSAKAETLFDDLREAVETDKLVLPTLPDVALKIRDAVESENSTAQGISDALDIHFRSIWSKSVDAAAISRMIATLVPGINSEQALLAGLIHNIGALPVLVLAESDEELFHDEEALGRVTYELQGEVGELILRHWKFDDHMIEVVKQCHNFNYDNGASASFVDIVQVALLQGRHVPCEFAPGSWADVPAFTRHGIDNEVNVVDIEENKEIIDNTKLTLIN